uniref:Uncharacterized protein n=1 Tax=Hyaloperonospora arabidopsidis (strain Emoy2) TaxID=559515 RepID=M4BB64_HYAAE
MDLWDVCNKIKLALLNSVSELRAAIGGCAIKVWNNDHTDNFFAGVVRFVSRYALVKVHEQMQLLDDPELCRKNCSGDFSTTLGLPCVQKIAARKLSGGVLHIGDFHAHWHLRCVGFSRIFLPTLHLDAERDNDSVTVEDLVQTMLSTYRYLDSHQQMAMHLQLTELGLQTFSSAHPAMARSKGRPNGARNKHPPGILAEGWSSTQREASQFELVEAAFGRKCGVCGQRGTRHNARTCPQRDGQASGSTGDDADIIS